MWTVKKKLESGDGRRNVELTTTPDGKLFRYHVNVWVSVDDDELLFHPDRGYWSCPEISGFFDSLSACENAAKDQLSWLGGDE